MLEPVLGRLASAPQIEVVVLENVPNFAKTLDGQDRSSYSFWVEGLIRVGFSKAYGDRNRIAAKLSCGY